jgi:hypothetical protein
MAITQNTLPSIPPQFTLPLDANMQFASAQTLTATGYVNNSNAQLTIGPGRFTGMLALDISAFTGTGPSANFVLMGSNDVNWGNGNVESLCSWDIALASAQRVVPTILGASPTIPPIGLAGALRALPFTNMTYGGYVFQYLKLYAVLAGTSPSLTLSAWVTPIEMKV